MDGTGVLQTLIDASYAVHENMRGQAGGAISMGHGVLAEKSIKQKSNGKSSTETELIGMSDMLPHTIWLSYFLENQGYILKDNILYQDNQSAIELEKNGIILRNAEIESRIEIPPENADPNRTQQ